MSYDHRDKIDITSAEVIKTTRTFKEDDRGRTGCDEIVIGEAWCTTGFRLEPFDFDTESIPQAYRQVGNQERLFVIAFPKDIHHRGMTEAEALKFGRRWLKMVKRQSAINKAREAELAAHDARMQAWVAKHTAEGLTVQEALEKYYPKFTPRA